MYFQSLSRRRHAPNKTLVLENAINAIRTTEKYQLKVKNPYYKKDKN